MFTDSKQLFDSVTKLVLRLQDNHTIRFGISRVGLVSGAKNPVDGISVITCNGSLLRLIRTSNQLPRRPARECRWTNDELQAA